MTGTVGALVFDTKRLLDFLGALQPTYEVVFPEGAIVVALDGDDLVVSGLGLFEGLNGITVVLIGGDGVNPAYQIPSQVSEGVMKIPSSRLPGNGGSAFSIEIRFS